MKNVDDIVKDPTREFPILWPKTSEMVGAVEKNEWHRSQDVLAHTYAVFNAVEPIIQGKHPYCSALKPLETSLEEFARSTVGNHSKLVLMKLAALLHDVGKPRTLIHNPDGSTSCPDHASVSAAIVQETLASLDLSPEDTGYTLELIAGHHKPDNFINDVEVSMDRDEFAKFRVDKHDLARDLLLFYLADFEGCDIEPSLDARKPGIFGLECQLLEEMFGGVR